MKIPFFRPSIDYNEIDAVKKCLSSMWLTTGPRVKEFEERFADMLGAGHAIAVNSCTAALHLALEAVGVKKGDKVIVPTMTFAATAEVVRYFDAMPLFVDCDRTTLCMDVGQIEKLLKRHRVKAVIPMHYGGQMCEMFEIKKLGAEHGFHIIEDSAHAFPACIKSGRNGKWVSPGKLSDISCFSFYANKCITTGEGGMAVTDNKKLADRMRLMSLHGMNRDAWKRFTSSGSWYYEIVAPGFKYNMTDIAASIGLCQLEKAADMHASRKAVAERYISGLKDISEIELPVELPGRIHSWHLFSIRFRSTKMSRNEFIDELKKEGIICSVHWKPLHMMPYYVGKYHFRSNDFPVAFDSWGSLVSLPIFPSMKKTETAYVINSIKKIIRKCV